MRKVLFFLVLVFLIGVVGAETNYALSGTPTITNQQVGANNYLVWRVNNAALNDGSESGVAHGIEISDQARFVTWGSWDSMLVFGSPVSQLDRIEVVAGIGAGVFLQTIQLKAQVYYSGSWWDAGEVNLVGVLGPTKNTYTFNQGVPWNNVEQIKVYAYAVNNPFSYVDYNIYEVRAWGPDACDPSLTCADYPGQCAVGLSDGCTNILDCSGNCGGDESCVAGACVVVGCAANDIIMKLDSDSNAHGAFWDDGSYSYDVCYLDIFEVAGDGNRVCSGSNKVLGLSNVSNAHAQGPLLENYLEKVCYGDLSCEYVAGACSGDYSCVVTVDSDDNAHLALCGSDDAYTNRICCMEGAPAPPLPELYWADPSGNMITNEQPNIGDTIQAIMTNAASGTFDIWENDGLTRIADDVVKTDVAGEADANGNWIYKWTITQADLDNVDGDFDEFYFNVDDGDDESNYIAINGTYDDSPMNLTIISPLCGEDFPEGDEVRINVSALDLDDFLEGNVSINGVVVETFTDDGVVFDYLFSSDGNYQIMAEAINTRGKRARHIANIMIVDLGKDSNYVAACIAEPKDFTDIDDYVVPFDASTTRGIEVVDSLKTIFTPEVNPTNFSWYWKFFMPDVKIREPFVKSDDIKAYKFTIEFPVAGQNSASLRVEFE